MSDTAAAPEPDHENTRRPDGRFGPGNPGRPFGTRNSMSRRAMQTLLADFDQHNEDILRFVRRNNAKEYLRMICGLLPKNPKIQGPAFEAFSDEDVARFLTAAKAQISRIERGEGSLDDLQALFE